MARRRFRLPPIIASIGEALAPTFAKALYSGVDSVLEDVEGVVGEVDKRIRGGRSKLGELGVKRRPRKIKKPVTKKPPKTKKSKKQPRVVEAPPQEEE